MARFVSAVTGLAAIAILVLVALYVARPGQTKQTLVLGPTPYPSITLYPTSTPEPQPDRSARVVDLASGEVTSAPVQPDGFIQAVLADGRLLVQADSRRIEVVSVDDGAARTLTESGTSDQPLVSEDGRYVAWLEGDHAMTFDTRSDEVTRGVPAGAHFVSSLGDGGLVFTRASGPVAVVNSAGAVTDGLTTYYAEFSPDARFAAWTTGSGLHIYDRRTQMTRVLPGVQYAVGQLAWSSDDAQIAYARVVHDNAVEVRVVDVASGDERMVYTAQPFENVDGLTILHERAWFHLLRSGDNFGIRYSVALDGTDVRAIDDPSRAWGVCGPACGMPPEGYEGPDGVAEWCEVKAAGGCVSHLDYIDRATGETREILAADRYFSRAVSSDRTRLALLRSEGEQDQVLRIVDLNDFSYREVHLGFSFANSIAWLPGDDGVLLYQGFQGN